MTSNASGLKGNQNDLGGDWIYPAAEVLVERSVPIVFTTGYDASTIPTRFKHIVRCEKPANICKVTQAIGRAVHSQQPAD